MLAFFLALIAHLFLFNQEAPLCAVQLLIGPRGELKWTQRAQAANKFITFTLIKHSPTEHIHTASSAHNICEMFVDLCLIKRSKLSVFQSDSHQPDTHNMHFVRQICGDKVLASLVL